MLRNHRTGSHSVPEYLSPSVWLAGVAIVGPGPLVNMSSPSIQLVDLNWYFASSVQIFIVRVRREMTATILYERRLKEFHRMFWSVEVGFPVLDIAWDLILKSASTNGRLSFPSQCSKPKPRSVRQCRKFEFFKKCGIPLPFEVIRCCLRPCNTTTDFFHVGCLPSRWPLRARARDRSWCQRSSYAHTHAISTRRRELRRPYVQCQQWLDMSIITAHVWVCVKVTYGAFAASFCPGCGAPKTQKVPTLRRDMRVASGVARSCAADAFRQRRWFSVCCWKRVSIYSILTDDRALVHVSVSYIRISLFSS